MCTVNVCCECKLFRLKEVTEGEYIGWCSFYDMSVDYVDGDKIKGDKHKI